MVKLVERMTYPKFPDIDLVAMVLLTYPTFTTGEELLYLLIHRYHAPKRRSMTPSQVEERKQMQLRVVNVMKHWVKEFWVDFEESPVMRRQLQTFIEQKVIVVDRRTAGQSVKELTKTLSRPKDEKEQDLIKFYKNMDFQTTVKEVTHKILQFSPSVLAEQFSRMEYSLFTLIPQYEFLNKILKRTDRGGSPHLDAFADSFNKMSTFIVASILSFKNKDERLNIIKFFISFGQRCVELNNFNGVMIVLSAFSTTAIHRLSKTFGSLASAKAKELQDLKALMDHGSSFKNYRAALQAVNPPCIPFLGLYLTDLTFIQDGNSETVKPGASKSSLPNLIDQAEPSKADPVTLINVEKKRLVHRIITEIKQFQHGGSYSLEEQKPLQLLMIEAEAAGSRLSEEELYQQSLEIQPR
eukprot:NODE_516_length_1405_cov_4.821596_g482_i0.p1 GENE.NODE_516_length_1405_cov_4.821596_g482_i0~~NODE_516_length_1405_cov_4.821596_g482_i0.p1  ORF type:complete len:442 (-),score=81.48 NODE_516_length_1405_cov_4.821596_g482_i0:79-1311(-)